MPHVSFTIILPSPRPETSRHTMRHCRPFNITHDIFMRLYTLNISFHIFYRYTLYYVCAVCVCKIFRAKSVSRALREEIERLLLRRLLPSLRPCSSVAETPFLLPSRLLEEELICRWRPRYVAAPSRVCRLPVHRFTDIAFPAGTGNGSDVIMQVAGRHG